MSAFASEVSIAELGALLSDAGRVRMLSALLAEDALTASDLAWHAGVTAQTASSHLGKLADAGLLSVIRQGQFRYYRLSSPLVARMLESLMVVAGEHGPKRHRPRSGPDTALIAARMCYDHLAGRLGVAITDSLLSQGFVELGEDAGVVTDTGERFFETLGLDLAAARARRRCFCRPCRDWSEQRPHIAGSVGARLAARLMECGWLSRVKDSRAVLITPDGAEGLDRLFGIDAEAIGRFENRLSSAA